MILLRRLDRLIDRMRRLIYRILPWSPFGLVASLGPFSRFGATGNVLICGVMLITGLVISGLDRESFGVAWVIGGVALEVVFARIAVRAWRGDFDDLPEGRNLAG